MPDANNLSMQQGRKLKCVNTELTNLEKKQPKGYKIFQQQFCHFTQTLNFPGLGEIRRFSNSLMYLPTGLLTAPLSDHLPPSTASLLTWAQKAVGKLL